MEALRQHYSDLFNCVRSDPYNVCNIANGEAVSISMLEVYQAIAQLGDNKVSGSDQVTAEHLELACPKLTALIAICFTGFMTHGLSPDTMPSVTLVPVIKDKAGKVGSLDNYRPIALASVLSNMEKIRLDR